MEEFPLSVVFNQFLNHKKILSFITWNSTNIVI